MRIGLDVSAVVPNRTGIGNYVAQLVRTLIRVAPEHQYVLYFTDPLPPADLAAFSGHPHVKLIHCHRLLMELRSRWERIDIFHGMNFKLRGWGRFGGVVTIHDLGEHRFILSSGSVLARRRSFRRVHRMALRASRVVTVSRHAAIEIMNCYGVPRQRMALVSPAVGPEFHPVVPPALAATVMGRYGIERGAFVLSSGGAEPRKNIPILIEAFKRSDLRGKMKLVVPGAMTPGGSLLEEAVDRAGLSGAVIFPGHVPVGDLRVLYASCAVFVFPSLYEGFGMPVLEAMACGVPVVCSSAASVPEVAGDAAILVEPTDVDQMAAAMKLVVSDAKISEDLCRRGLLRIRAFTWERSAHELLHVYADLANPQRVT